MWSEVTLSYITPSLTGSLAVGHSRTVDTACVTVLLNTTRIMNLYMRSSHLIYRTCRALCSSRGQTWTRLEMPSAPCADLIPRRSCQASPLSSPPSPSEQRLLLSAVSKQGATCRMGCSSTLTVKDLTLYFVLQPQHFCRAGFNLHRLLYLFIEVALFFFTFII